MTPVLQNAALEEMGLDVRNVAFRVRPEGLGEAVRGGRALGLLGLMVTIPHKVAVIDYLDEIDDFANCLRSVNLVHFIDGQAIGYNTDGYAASRSLQEEGVNLQGAHVCIVGAGGSARCLAQKFSLDGAARISLVNRTLSRAEALVADIAPHYPSLFDCHPLTDEALAKLLPKCDVLVNASSVGMHPKEDQTPVPSSHLHPGLVAYDIVYNPLETRLLREAREKGCTTVNGVGMLVYTNEKAVEICTGHVPPVQTMRRACEEALKARQRAAG